MRRLTLALVCALAAITAASCGSTPTYGGRVHSPAFVKGAELPGLPAGPLQTLPFGATFTIGGADAVTLRNVPSTTAAVGCYVTGAFANCGEARARFPHAHIVSIATRADFIGAKCLDTEPGDSVPWQVAGWIRASIRAGVYRPCDYTSLSEMGSVRADLNASGIPRSEYLLWVAHWTGRFGVELGFDAEQYFSNCCIDRDAFLSYFFDTKPTPPPPPPVICFGPRAQLRNATCIRVRPEVAKWSRARDASKRALVHVERGLRANHCRRPYRRDVCVDLGREIAPTLRKRERYFAGKVAATIRTYS